MPSSELVMDLYWICTAVSGSGWLFLLISGRAMSLSSTTLTVLCASLLLVHALLMPHQIEAWPWRSIILVLHGLVAGPMLLAVLLVLRTGWRAAWMNARQVLAFAHVPVVDR